MTRDVESHDVVVRCTVPSPARRRLRLRRRDFYKQQTFMRSPSNSVPSADEASGNCSL